MNDVTTIKPFRARGVHARAERALEESLQSLWRFEGGNTVTNAEDALAALKAVRGAPGLHDPNVAETIEHLERALAMEERQTEAFATRDEYSHVPAIVSAACQVLAVTAEASLEPDRDGSAQLAALRAAVNEWKSS